MAVSHARMGRELRQCKVGLQSGSEAAGHWQRRHSYREEDPWLDLGSVWAWACFGYGWLNMGWGCLCMLLLMWKWVPTRRRCQATSPEHGKGTMVLGFQFTRCTLIEVSRQLTFSCPGLGSVVFFLPMCEALLIWTLLTMKILLFCMLVASTSTYLVEHDMWCIVPSAHCWAIKLLID